MTTTTADLKPRLLACLQRGKVNATSGKDLAVQLGERDTRRIRLAIIALITEDHQPICFAIKKGEQPSGYFLAKNRAEVNESLNVLRRGYAMELFRHYHYLKLARDKMLPQIEMKL